MKFFTFSYKVYAGVRLMRSYKDNGGDRESPKEFSSPLLDIFRMKCTLDVFILFCCFAVLGIEPMALHMLNMCSEVYSHSC